MVSGQGMADALSGSSTENRGRFTSSKTCLKRGRVPGAAQQ